jgi:hypothetical protein
MNPRKSLFAPGLRVVAGLMAVVATAVVMAGGGVDSGGTGRMRLSYSIGRLSGFGSIVVNGVHYDETRALVLDDEGGLHYRDELKLGMTLDVTAGPVVTDESTGVSSSVADKIVLASAIRGPLQGVDWHNFTITVLGQTVKVNTDTVFTPPAGGMAGIRNGQVLEVHAMFDAASGQYVATRVDLPPVVTSYKLRGAVSRIDTTARTFYIGNARISYANALPGEVPALAEGAVVKVNLRTTAGKGGTWELLGGSQGNKPVPPDADSVAIDGIVSAYHGLNDFKLNGTAANAAGAGVVFTGGTNGQLANGVRVLVTGTMSNKVLVAGEVEYRQGGSNGNGSPETVTLHGNVQSADSATRTFVVRGNTVAYDANTRFDHGTPSKLVPGAEVDVTGALCASGTRVCAAKIKFGK